MEVAAIRPSLHLGEQGVGREAPRRTRPRRRTRTSRARGPSADQTQAADTDLNHNKAATQVGRTLAGASRTPRVGVSLLCGRDEGGDTNPLRTPPSAALHSCVDKHVNYFCCDALRGFPSRVPTFVNSVNLQSLLIRCQLYLESKRQHNKEVHALVGNGSEGDWQLAPDAFTVPVLDQDKLDYSAAFSGVVRFTGKQWEEWLDVPGADFVGPAAVIISEEDLREVPGWADGLDFLWSNELVPVITKTGMKQVQAAMIQVGVGHAAFKVARQASFVTTTMQIEVRKEWAAQDFWERAWAIQDQESPQTARQQMTQLLGEVGAPSLLEVWGLWRVEKDGDLPARIGAKLRVDGDATDLKIWSGKVGALVRRPPTSEADTTPVVWLGNIPIPELYTKLDTDEARQNGFDGFTYARTQGAGIVLRLADASTRRTWVDALAKIGTAVIQMGGGKEYETSGWPPTTTLEQATQALGQAGWPVVRAIRKATKDGRDGPARTTFFVRADFPPAAWSLVIDGNLITLCVAEPRSWGPRQSAQTRGAQHGWEPRPTRGDDRPGAPGPWTRPAKGGGKGKGGGGPPAATEL
uniref:Uncharacterized protein n=1 Tax=Oxyrrhis marina TaxID=2969 RepID=A0A7S4GMM8_OXYMA|mmetsp:Transcript_54226/g.144655  ORF Transcript_54226/g.144655 Transcript_54226/m.144655 type:complete len:580 (+) Transcript_54226:139-1878(+)